MPLKHSGVTLVRLLPFGAVLLLPDGWPRAVGFFIVPIYLAALSRPRPSRPSSIVLVVLGAVTAAIVGVQEVTTSTPTWIWIVVVSLTAACVAVASWPERFDRVIGGDHTVK